MKASFQVLFALAVTAAVIVSPLTAHGAVPNTISYQGVLTEPSGVAVQDGPYSVRFRLYQVDGTTVAWEETQSVAVAGGRFSVLLGSVVSLGTLAFNQPYLLGIKVGGDPELTPLTPLASAPYSLAARSLAMAPTTRYYSVSPEAFTPGSPGVSYARNTVRVSASSMSASLATPLNLPHGARLTQWRVLFDDVDATREVTIALRRTNLTTGTFQQLAAFASGVANAAGLTLATGSSFTDDVIDNQNWSYSLQAFWGTPGGTNVSLAGVGVTYTIAEPLP